MSQEQLKKQMIEWRHHLHENPESAFEETKTADFVAEKLLAMGLEVHRNIGKTGLVGILKCGDSPDVIGLRADMDCIQLTETSNLPYASKTPNRMHACGHDGHTSVLLGAAKLLAQRKNFNGSVCFVFQPSEEPGWGAKP